MDDRVEKIDEACSQTPSEIAATWNTAQETFLAAIADRANGMRWMHNKCQIMYANWNFYLTVPAILMSTVAGSATIGLPTLFPNNQANFATTVIGLMTLSTGVLTTLNQYMKSSQLAESHRAMGVENGKLHRVISGELALRRDQRRNALEFLTFVRSEQDRLQNISPDIPESVITKFRKLFDGREDLEKPEIAGDLDHVQVNGIKKGRSSQNTTPVGWDGHAPMGIPASPIFVNLSSATGINLPGTVK